MSFCKILLTKNSLPQKDREFSAHSNYFQNIDDITSFLNLIGLDSQFLSYNCIVLDIV